MDSTDDTTSLVSVSTCGCAFAPFTDSPFINTWCIIVDEDGSSDFNLLLDLNQSVSIEIEMIGSILESQVVGTLSGFRDLDVGGSLWKFDNIMVSWREVAFVETSFNGFAGGAISITLSALLSITSNWKTFSINTDIVALGITLGSIDNLISPFVVKVSGFWFANQFTPEDMDAIDLMEQSDSLVLSLVWTPFVIVSIESLIVELRTLLGAEVSSVLTWLQVTRDVTDRSASAITAGNERI
ncbi:hypothetical protein GCK72_019373 [Caenorhabditis remanei]|uniref:Uncharacterized protein n=1 Tax=Caenorhabditis remanei TaxID=31234 RepID=A0A6A5GCG9_CAERE|nr:hypothetical protein GCK72_019373 [Caenorhabditis remanei]KAF1752818.1 hypothetical protein GCK72_019373 [Caenorhabditis remanei]